MKFLYLQWISGYRFVWLLISGYMFVWLLISGYMQWISGYMFVWLDEAWFIKRDIAL
jgi:hypothetical protein